MLSENGHEGAGKDLEPTFFPEACVVEVLTDEVIVWVLGCSCNQCEKDAKYSDFCHDPRTEYLESITNKNRKRLKLFAILIYIEHPVLVSGFVSQNIDDKAMEDRHSNELGRMDRYWPNLRKKESEEGVEQVGLANAEAKGIVDAFLKVRHQFLLPTIDTDSFVAFDDNRILPFINQRRVTKAKGNYGTVFSFQFYPGYLALEGFSNRVSAFLVYQREGLQMTRTRSRKCWQGRRFLDKLGQP